jgi:hypothetical protein
MFKKPPVLCESLATRFAFIGFIFSMIVNMICKVQSYCETLTTNVTLIRTFSCVQSLMNHERAFTSKTFRTNFAFVDSFSSMGVNVSHEIITLHKGFIAIFTL